MLRKVLAGICTLLFAAGVTTVVSTAASAHTGDLNATAVCQSDGTYLVTYKLTTANTQLTGTTYWKIGTTTFEGTPTSNAGLTNGPISTTGSTTVTLGTTTLPGNSTKAPWAYAYTTWSDHYKVGSDGGDITLDGKCKPPSTNVTPVDPTIVDKCGTANDSVTLPANTSNVTYSGPTNGYVYATLVGDNVVWAASHPGWTSASGGKLKFAIPTFNTDPCSHDEVVCWLMDNYKGGSHTPSAGNENTFPQTRVDCDATIPCGMWIQKDWYTIDTAAKETVWTNLGDTLTWVNGHPEDQSIYVKHTFTYGGDCPPPPSCTIGDKSYERGDTLPDGYTWTDGGDCIPPVHVCEYIDGTATDVTYPDGQVPEDAIPWVDGSECTPPPYCTIGETKYYDGDTLPDHYTWKSDGECDYTPPICVYNDVQYWDENDLPEGVLYDGESCYVPPFCTIGDAKYYDGDQLPDGYIWTGQGECLPPVDVCIGGAKQTITWLEYTQGDFTLYDEETCKPPHTPEPPTLTATLVPMCIDNVPFVDWGATLTDPDMQSTNHDTVTFTFLNTKNGDGNWTSEDLPLADNGDGTWSGSGTFTWPFASYTGSLPGTITGTEWPGWIQHADDSWEDVGNANGGWTRGGVDVLAKVNPEYTVSGVEYPPATFPCNGPDLHAEEDAPPAEAVDGEASYAG
jgi:hypothetical protein